MTVHHWYCCECGRKRCSRREDALANVGIIQGNEVVNVICPFSMQMTDFVKVELTGLVDVVEAGE